MGTMAVDRDEMIKGDDYSYVATLTTTSAGVTSAYNGSGSTWSATLRDTSEPTSTSLATMSVDTTSAASGILTVSTTDTVTAAITGTRATWSLKETTAGGLEFTWVKVECVVVDVPTA